MDKDVLQTIDPRELGRRLQEARKAGGWTQHDVAERLGMARTTVTAIEKGERRVHPFELIELAAFYGRRVGELLRRGEPVAPFAVQLRAAVAPGSAEEADIAPSTATFQQLCEDYIELERICGAPLQRNYPAPYEIGSIAPEVAAEDVAGVERNRLGLGDGPLLNLREVLENDVGLRVFYLALPSRVAGMFAYTEQLGGCIAINGNHPPERGRMSLAHEYGHFLSKRFQPEVALLGQYQRQPDQERFADSFARSFLMPAAGMRRRYHELHRSKEGRLTPADLCILGNQYFVSVEALTRRLEELRLLPMGTWDRLALAGFRVREAQTLLELALPPAGDHRLPTRYLYLAAEAFDRSELSEGQFARFLRMNRVEARETASQLANRAALSDEGTVGTLPLDLGASLTARGV